MHPPEGTFTGEELQRLNDALHEMTLLIAGEEEPRRQIQLIMDLAKQFMHAQASSLMRLDSRANELYWEYAHGDFKSELLTHRIPADQGIAGWAVTHDEQVYVEDAYQDNRFNPEVDKSTGQRTKCMLTVPLKAKGVILGVLQVINPVKGYFHSGEARLFKHFADMAAIAIHRNDIDDALGRQVRELSALHEVSKAISSEFHLQPMLERIMELAKEVMKAEASSLMLLDQETDELVFQVAQGAKGGTLKARRMPKSGGIAGWVATHGEPLLIEDAYADSRFNPDFDRKTGFRTRSILTAPLKAKGEVLGIVQVINPLERRTFEETDLAIFQFFADSAAVAVNNAQLYEKSVENERLLADLETASAIQHEILPRAVAPVTGFEVATYYEQPHQHEPAGDYYDLLALDDDRLCALVADVSGHGTGASLVMAMTKALLHSAVGMGQDFRSAIVHVNDTLVKILSSSEHTMFVTAILLLINPKEGRAELVRCGHTPLLHYRDGKTTALSPNGMLLGILSGPDFESTLEVLELDYQVGDAFVLFTDGISEAMNTAAEMFTEERLLEVVEGLGQQRAGRLLDDLLGEVYFHMDGEPMRDDITLVVMKCLDLHRKVEA